MHSPLTVAMFNRSLGEMAGTWGVTPGQAADRFRRLPFVRLAREPTRGKRGRPGRRVEFDGSWNFLAGNPRRPLSQLLAYLRQLHEFGEPYALGLPLTSVYLRPFLYPQVRVYAPLETVSAWRALFGGRRGALEVVVDVLQEGAPVQEAEGLPLLGPGPSMVDALLAYREFQGVTVLALADRLVHSARRRDQMMRWAAEKGLDLELRALSRHRGNRALSSREVRSAHERLQELSRLPPARFSQLADRREAFQ